MNKEIIKKYVGDYIKQYEDKFGERPKSWFSLLNWLSSFTMAGSFDNSDIEYAKLALRGLI